MSLTLTLDAPLRLQLEPGYRRSFGAAELAQAGGALAPLSRRNLWAPPGIGSLQLKPLQLQPDFLNHQAQLDAGAVLRLTDFFVSPTDLSSGAITEIQIGSSADPWIQHVPASNLLGPPTRVVTGIPPVFHNLQQVADQSETGSAGVFDTTPSLPTPVPNALLWLAFSTALFPQNQGWLFRWWVAPPHLGRHQQVYAFVFAQYCALCRGALLELYEDVDGSRANNWQLRYRESLFAPGRSDDVNHLNPDWRIGRELPEDSVGHFASLMVIPCARHKVLFLAHTGQYLVAFVRAHPQRTADGKEWDILRSGNVEVWALTPQIGQFQVQKIMYVAPPTAGGEAPTLFLPNIITDYTPAIFPTIHADGDHDADSQLLPSAATFPKDYTFPQTPLSDDCPDPTTFATAQGRTFGEHVRFVSSTDQRRSPELYRIEVIADPVFQQNPAAAFLLQDQFAGGSAIQHGDLSLGSSPGDGRLTLTTWDTGLPTPGNPNGYPLAPYRYRCEVPLQLALDGQFAFTGYTDRIEVQPLRQDPIESPKAPVEFRFRCNDRWLLLEETILREQRDWQGIGHITVVDTIARQCGIDTGPLHWDGSSLYPDGGQVLCGGSLAEYPTGWDGARASLYNTPLGTPILTADNLEGNQLLGWKPQPHDTGATFLERIRSLFSNWLMGFRADGTFYYLPYTYFATSTVTFHAHSDRSVDSGANFNPANNVGLNLFISGGQVTIGGQSAAFGDLTLLLPDNSESTVYAQQTGTGVQIVHNTTNIPPENAVTIGQAITAGGQIVDSSDSVEAGRQVKGSPIARRPVEYRTIEPSGNYVQVVSHYQLDQTANRSGIFVDWASILNPKAVNYLGRPKWFIVEAGGAFSCAQLNRMAYIAFQAARRRRLRVSFDGTYVPTLKIGQILTLEGEGDFRLLEMRVSFTRKGWSIANYVAEKVESGYGLPS